MTFKQTSPLWLRWNQFQYLLYYTQPNHENSFFKITEYHTFKGSVCVHYRLGHENSQILFFYRQDSIAKFNSYKILTVLLNSHLITYYYTCPTTPFQSPVSLSMFPHMSSAQIYSIDRFLKSDRKIFISEKKL